MSTITEKRALGILKEELLSTYSIDPHIPEDDKEAILLINKLFEGDIYTLRAETFAK